MLCSARRDGRADEGTGLENRYWRRFIAGSEFTFFAIDLAAYQAAAVEEYPVELSGLRVALMMSVVAGNLTLVALGLGAVTGICFADNGDNGGCHRCML